MTTEIQRSELLEQFQTYLEGSGAESAITYEQPDLSALLSELAGLRTEVKAESRQFKNTLDALNSALLTVQEDNKTLAKEISESRRRMEQQQDDIVNTMLLEFVDMYDRLVTGTEVLKKYHPIKSVFKSSRKQDIKFIKQFKEGQIMTLKRFDQLLQKYQVHRIDCVGQLLDPTTMIAVETANDQKIENGRVLEELRIGFLYKKQVLRFAEVKVNKVNAR